MKNPNNLKQRIYIALTKNAIMNLKALSEDTGLSVSNIVQILAMDPNLRRRFIKDEQTHSEDNRRQSLLQNNSKQNQNN